MSLPRFKICMISPTPRNSIRNLEKRVQTYMNTLLICWATFTITVHIRLFSFKLKKIIQHQRHICTMLVSE